MAKSNKRRDGLSLADHVRRAASRSGLSVNQIARESDVDQSTLNKFLNGTRDNLRLDVADRLFCYFGLSVTHSGRFRPRT